MFGVNKMRIIRIFPYLYFKIFNFFNVLVGQYFYINGAGFFQNFIGNLLMRRANRNKNVHSFPTDESSYDGRLWKDGYVLLKSSVNDIKIQELSEKFNDWCGKNIEKESQYRLQVSSKDYGDEFLEDFPEIETLLNGTVESIIRNYYNSDFEVINIHLYRTRKPEIQNKRTFNGAYGGTVYWHSDGSFTDTLKIFYLLSEVKDVDGPMLFLDKSRSGKIFRSKIPFNFLKDGRPELPHYQEHTGAFTGSPGQCLIVDTNRCLHRASVPNDKPRDMIVFYVGVKSNLALGQFHNIKRSGEGLAGRFL